MIPLRELNAHFKAKEKAQRSCISNEQLFVLRLDGRAFHTFTKAFERPFSADFLKLMKAAAEAVEEHLLPRQLFTYIQSDEISVVASGFLAELPFGGKTDKLLSLSASAATAGACSAGVIPAGAGLPLFDARLTFLQDFQELRDYMTWRRMDARKNAISMAADHLFGHKALLQVSTRERLELLKGTRFETIEGERFNGSILHRPALQEELRSPSVWTEATREFTEELVALEEEKVRLRKAILAEIAH